MKASWEHYEHTRSSKRKDIKEGTQDQSNTTFRHQWRKINNMPQLSRTLEYVQKDNLNYYCVEENTEIKNKGNLKFIQ